MYAFSRHDPECTVSRKYFQILQSVRMVKVIEYLVGKFLPYKIAETLRTEWLQGQRYSILRKTCTHCLTFPTEQLEDDCPSPPVILLRRIEVGHRSTPRGDMTSTTICLRVTLTFGGDAWHLSCSPGHTCLVVTRKGLQGSQASHDGHLTMFFAFSVSSLATHEYA